MLNRNQYCFTIIPRQFYLIIHWKPRYQTNVQICIKTRITQYTIIELLIKTCYKLEDLENIIEKLIRNK